MTCLEEGIYNNVGGAPLVWIQLMFNYVANFFILVTNLVILTAILRYRNRGKIPPNARASTTLVTNLSVSSIGLAISAAYYFSYNYFCSLARNMGMLFWPCLLRSTLVLGTLYATGYFNISIALDRYCALVYVLSYEKTFTARRADLVALIIWVVALLQSQVLLVWNNWSPGTPCHDSVIVPKIYMIIFWYIVPICQLVSVTYFHWKIYVIAKSVKQRNNDQPVTAFNDRSGQTMISVVPMYYLCWGPFIICMGLGLAGVHVPGEIATFCVSFSSIYYLYTPIRYSLYNVVVKNSLIELFELVKKRMNWVNRCSISAANSNKSAALNFESDEMRVQHNPRASS